MANGRRRLSIEIEGDNDSFDQAARQSQARASAFDQTLQDLERSEREAREEADRNAAAMQRLERAQEAARGASERLARGEIDAAEAARLQAEANQQLQRVLRATAMANRAAAAAADDLAEEQREAARAAELAAARQRLAQLRAAGATREHDRLLTQLQARFGDLGAEGDRAFTRMGSAAKASGSAMTSPKGGLVKIVALLGSLPWLSSAAASILTLGLGAALVGIGLKASMGSARVKKELDSLKKHVKSETKDMAKPFEATWLRIADSARDTFDSLAPDLAADFEELAPYASAFADDFIGSFEELRPAIHDVTEAAGPLLDTFGNEMPGLMGRVADAISRIAKSADPEMFSRMINGLGVLITGAGHAVAVLSDLASAMYKFGPIAIAARHIDEVGGAFAQLSGHGGTATTAMDKFNATSASSAMVANLTRTATEFMAEGMGSASGRISTMSQTMKLASQTAEQLKASLDRLAGRTLTLREASSAYQDAIDSASASIKENGRNIGFATTKARANEAALNTLARSAHAQAVAMRDSGRSASSTAAFMDNARRKFISTAQQMGYTRSQAVSLANKLYGIKAAVNSIPSRRTIDIILRHISTGAVTGYGYEHHAEGGPVGYAAGGSVRGYPTGGMVRGPGGPKTDSIPAMLSNGEYVINAAATSAYRPLLEAINSGRTGGASMPMPRAAGGGGGGVLQVFLSIGDRPLGEILINPLKKSIQTRGGNVQAVLGVAGR